MRDRTRSRKTPPTSKSLHKYDNGEALRFIRQRFSAISWTSETIENLLESDFQRDWQREAGHWLLMARDHGYLEYVEGRLKAAYQPAQSEKEKSDRFNRFIQEMGPTMVDYYFSRTGWKFVEAEPCCPPGVDVDLVLREPYGCKVDIQIKCPDQPGKVIANKIVDGEHDSRIVTAARKAVEQLPRTNSRPAIVVIVANRTWPLPLHPEPVESLFIGATRTWIGTGTELRKKDQGIFFNEGRHVSAVVMLHYLRGISKFYYVSTVLLNPISCRRSKCYPSWFSGSSVCYFEDGLLKWKGRKPTYSIISMGTLVEK